MLINKWLLVALGALTAVVGYLGTVDWNTMAPTYAGGIVMALGLVKALVGSLMPPASQTTIVKTGGSVVTHTSHAWLALLLLLGAGLHLAGCASLTTLAGATVNPNYAYAAAQTFDAAETTADAYLRLPPCAAGGPPLCRKAAAVKAIVPAIRTGRTARKAVVAALQAANGGAIPVASYNTLQGAIETLNAAYANYSIAAPTGN